ncbi:unnamed protein product, partial [Brachionus calyciflorus]
TLFQVRMVEEFIKKTKENEVEENQIGDDNENKAAINSGLEKQVLEQITSSIKTNAYQRV